MHKSPMCHAPSEILNRFKLGRGEGADSSGAGGGQQTLQALFKDKKLNKLWDKAEHSGFTRE